MKRKTGFLLVSMLLIVTGVFAQNESNKVKGNGKIATKEVRITEYDKISCVGNIIFKYEQSSASPYLQIKTDENILEVMVIEVTGKTLTIHPKSDPNSLRKKRNYSIYPTVCVIQSNSPQLKEMAGVGGVQFEALSPLNANKLEVSLAGGDKATFGKLNSRKLNLSIAGSGTITVSDLKTDELEGSVAGGGTILLTGETEKGNLDVAGGGDIKTFGCKIKEAECGVAGGGTIEVYASDKLDASVAGGGKIRYKGNPELEKSVIGGGSVKKNEE